MLGKYLAGSGLIKLTVDSVSDESLFGLHLLRRVVHETDSENPKEESDLISWLRN